MENAMIKHVTPFAVILSLSSLVGFLAMLRAFFDGEVFDAGSMVCRNGGGSLGQVSDPRMQEHSKTENAVLGPSSLGSRGREYGG